MIARLSIYTNVDLELADHFKQWLEGDGAGCYDDLPGFRGSMTLVDRDNARVVGLGFYDSAGEALESEAMLATIHGERGERLPERFRVALGALPESVGLYEVVQQD